MSETASLWGLKLRVVSTAQFVFRQLATLDGFVERNL